MTPAIDATYRSLIAELPADLRVEAAALPARLRMTPDGSASWEGYSRLDAMYDLPAFAAEDPRRPGALLVTPGALARFRTAHYCAGYYAFLYERLADRQGAPSAADVVLGRALLGFWRRELARATGDAALAAREIDSSMAAWRRGVRIERVARAGGGASRGVVPLGVYVRAVGLKARWVAASAVCLLASHGQASRVRAFRRAYGLMLVSLQCIDDVQDMDEDETLLGVSVPEALGVSPDALLAASPPIARLGAQVAARGGFHRLSAWLTARAELVATHAPPRTTSAQVEAEAAALVEKARRRLAADRGPSASRDDDDA